MKKKAAKKSSKSTKAEEPVTPSLVDVMNKIAERLESLERKTDAIMGRLSNSSHPSRPQHQTQSSHPFTQSHSSHPRPHPPQHQNQNPGQQGQNRHMYQATCADCKKSCEVPFKPTGERPVYCKECFADRKANKNGNSAKGASLSHAAFQQRELRVTKNGVGRVRVSEMVPAGRPGVKSRKPAKFAKAKR